MESSGNAFTCRMCGECCQGSGGIVVTRDEQERIAEFLGRDLLSFQKSCVQYHGAKSLIRSNQDGWCIFFDSSKGCLIHPVKPGPCRAWPFFRGNLIDDSTLEMAKDFCPGINPDIDFQEFVRQGLIYLRNHGLSVNPDAGSANALNIKDLSIQEKHPGQDPNNL